MARQRIITYAMLTLELRLQLLEEIQARREAQIATCLPPDSLELRRRSKTLVENGALLPVRKGL